MASTEWAGSDFQAPPRTDGGVALCAACRRTGACRLGLSTEVLGADDVARFDIVCPPEHEGGPGVAHGGWTAAVLDEVLGHVPLLHGTLSVTKKLEVEYLRPVPIGRPLVAVRMGRAQGARLLAHRRRTRAGGDATRPLARARGVWALRDRSHFARYERLVGRAGRDCGERAVEPASVASRRRGRTPPAWPSTPRPVRRVAELLEDLVGVLTDQASGSHPARRLRHRDGRPGAQDRAEQRDAPPRRRAPSRGGPDRCM